MKHGGWLLLKTRLSCEGKRGRTQLRWEDERKTKHTIVLPVARSGNLLEVLYFPPGCNALCWQPSSNNADCNWSEISLKPVSKFESKFRRFRRVWHYYRKFSSVGRRSIGLTGLLWLMDIDKAYKLCGELRDDSPQEDYQNWLSQHDKLLAGDKKLISKKINRWNYIPKFRFHIVGQGDDRQFKTTVDSIEKICFPAEYIAIVCPGDFTDNPDVRNGNASSDEWQWVIPAGSIVSESSLYRIAHIINAYPGKQFITVIMICLIRNKFAIHLCSNRIGHQRFCSHKTILVGLVYGVIMVGAFPLLTIHFMSYGYGWETAFLNMKLLILTL